MQHQESRSPRLPLNPPTLHPPPPGPLVQPARSTGAGQPLPSLAVSIVSDSPLLREGLASLLGAHLSFMLAGCYGAADAPCACGPAALAHVALIDCNIGPGALTAWARRCRDCAPPAAVIVLELADDPAVILDAVAAGASGYTLRGATGAEVAQAIQEVCSGQARCSPEVTARLFHRLAELSAGQGGPAGVAPGLTPRELDVLRLIAADYSNKQIAAALVIEVRTVKHHVHNLLEKLRLRHRWDVARLAVERGWASPAPDEGRVATTDD